MLKNDDYFKIGESQAILTIRQIASGLGWCLQLEQSELLASELTGV